MRHIIGILLQNEAGALTRVTGLFSTRGYNLESLSVAATDDPSVSRVTPCAAAGRVPPIAIVGTASTSALTYSISGYSNKMEAASCTMTLTRFDADRMVGNITCPTLAGKTGDATNVKVDFDCQGSFQLTEFRK